MARDSKQVSDFFFKIGYWVGFIFSAIFFSCYSIFSLLSKFPGLAFFANPFKVGSAVIANLTWVLSTACEAELGLRESSSIGKKIREAFFEMSENETMAGISGFGAAIAIGLALAFPPAALAFTFVSAIFMCASNAFWTKGEESRLKTLLSKEPNKELHSDIAEAHKQQVKYAAISTVSSIILVAAIASSIIFPPIAPIALLFSVATAAVAATFKLKNLYLNYKVSKKKRILNADKELASEGSQKAENTLLNKEMSTRLKAHVEQFYTESEKSKQSISRKQNSSRTPKSSSTTEYERSKANKDKTKNKSAPADNSRKKNKEFSAHSKKHTKSSKSGSKDAKRHHD